MDLQFVNSIDKTSDEKGFRIRHAIYLALALLMFFGYEIGIRPLASPDEGRYVEIPREMVETCDYITPRLNGVKYFEKPALFYWLQSASIKMFGINTTSMRIWCMIFALLGCMFLYWIGSLFYSRKIGILSSCILATNILYYAHSRLIILDLVLSTFVSAALWFFYAAFVQRPKSDRLKNTFILAFYAMCSLACLTKGLIGIVLPGIVISAWVLLTRRWNVIKEILYIPGILLFVCIFTPWHALVAMKNPEFLHFYFVVEHFLRYTTKMHCRYQPCWFFLPILIAGTMPWTGFSLVACFEAIKKAINKDSESIFLVSWILSILCFFSFSSSKLVPYILPISPPIALLTSIFIINACDDKCKKPFDYKNKYSIASLISVCFLLCACFSFPIWKNFIGESLRSGEGSALVYAISSILLILAAILIAFMFTKKYKLYLILWYLFAAINLMFVINKAAVYYQEERRPSTKFCAESLALNKKEGDLVYCYKTYHQDFPVHLNSCVGVVDFLGELEFGAQQETNPEKFITTDTLIEKWEGKKRIFLLLNRQQYRELFATFKMRHRIIDFDKHFILIVNK